MIEIIKKPATKFVKLFKCPCGCEFTAESEDYTFCYAINSRFHYCTIECPICHITHIYPIETIETIEVNIE